MDRYQQSYKPQQQQQQPQESLAMRAVWYLLVLLLVTVAMGILAMLTDTEVKARGDERSQLAATATATVPATVPATNLQWFVIDRHPQATATTIWVALYAPPRLDGVPLTVLVFRGVCECISTPYSELEYRVGSTDWLSLPIRNDALSGDTTIVMYVVRAGQWVTDWAHPDVPKQQLSQLPHVDYCSTPFTRCVQKRRSVRP